MKRTWKPTVAGIIDVTVGLLGIGFLIVASIWYKSVLPLVLLPFSIPPLVGGVCALRRRVWWLTLVGSILVFPIGIVSLILIALSKEEFKRATEM